MLGFKKSEERYSGGGIFVWRGVILGLKRSELSSVKLS